MSNLSPILSRSYGMNYGTSGYDIMAKLRSYGMNYGTPGSDQIPMAVDYACARDDDWFMHWHAWEAHSPEEMHGCPGCRLEWVYTAVDCDSDLFLEILEGNAEDVWVDGDEVALSVLYPAPFQLPYALAAEALQALKRRQASECFENQQMAEMR